MSQQGPHFSPRSTAKTMIKAHFSGRMVSSCISYVAFASVYSEKTHLKKLMMMMMMKMMIIIMNKSQETTVFSGHQILTSAMKLRPVMVDFKFDALYR